MEILDVHHRFRVCDQLGIKPRYEVRTFDNQILEEIFLTDVNLARRQLEVYSRITLQDHQRKLYTKLGKNAESEGGKLANYTA